MGTNIMDFVAEAWRVLQYRGRMKVSLWPPNLLCAMVHVMQLYICLWVGVLNGVLHGGG